MKPFSAFFLLFSLLSFAFVIDGIRSPEDYWKSIMNDEAMPEAITDLLHDQDMNPEPENTKFSMDSKHYIRNFDVRPNVILYHSDSDSKRVKKSSSADGDDEHYKLKEVVRDIGNN